MTGGGWQHHSPPRPLSPHPKQSRSPVSSTSRLSAARRAQPSSPAPAPMKAQVGLSFVAADARKTAEPMPSLNPELASRSQAEGSVPSGRAKVLASQSNQEPQCAGFITNPEGGELIVVVVHYGGTSFFRNLLSSTTVLLNHNCRSAWIPWAIELKPIRSHLRFERARAMRS